MLKRHYFIYNHRLSILYISREVFIINKCQTEQPILDSSPVIRTEMIHVLDVYNDNIKLYLTGVIKSSLLAAIQLTVIGYEGIGIVDTVTMAQRLVADTGMMFQVKTTDENGLHQQRGTWGLMVGVGVRTIV